MFKRIGNILKVDILSWHSVKKRRMFWKHQTRQAAAAATCVRQRAFLHFHEDEEDVFQE
jgi:hypothetical protein